MCTADQLKRLNSTRLAVGMMVFFACFINYMMRVNISVIIIAMCPDSKQSKLRENVPLTDNMTLADCLAYRRAETPLGVTQTTYDWSTKEQAYVMSGYFWGYTATSVVGGVAAEYWGLRKLVFITTMFSALMTMLCPLAANISLGALIAARVLCGAGGGILFPALHSLVAHWAPPHEKGKFVSALLGGAIGTVVTWTIIGPIIKVWGWEWGFYLTGVMTVIWCLVWLYIVYDSPTLHPRISENERKYILDSLGERVAHGKTKVVPPIWNILTSSPFLAMVLLHFGSCWGLYFVMTVGPKFVASCLKFDMAAVGGLTALPYLFRMLFSICFGVLGDRIVKKSLMNLTAMRKSFTFFSHMIPGLMLVGIAYSTSPGISIFLMTLAIGSNGAATLTNLVNHQDLAPNFAGTLYAFANTIGNVAGFMTPIVTAEYTRHGQTLDNWRPVFLIGAALYICTAFYFIIFGTSNMQKWNSYGYSTPT